MLTMKHVFSRKENAREIGTYTVQVSDKGLLHFVAYESDEFGRSAGCWGGPEYNGGNIPENHSVAAIYVMNSRGTTIATYRYLIDNETLVDHEPPALPEAVHTSANTEQRALAAEQAIA